jgi:2,4-dienoyl-CoA reductase-like NADH-dependent reductase (Old Yellow Enzyme family)
MPSESHFPRLFSPLAIGSVTLRNRIVSTGHDTSMAHEGHITERLIAYQEARARGGVGLIIAQAAGIHDSARYTSHVLMASDDSCIDGYRRLARAVHAFDCRLFGQLFHPGREIMEGQDGSAPIAYAPSAVPNERFHVMPRPLSRRMIAELVRGYGEAASRQREAGLDGCEVVASHGYLPAQFLNPQVNRRADDYGGSLANRMRFLAEVLESIRRSVGSGFVVGLRISGDEQSHDATAIAEVLDVCRALDGFDYFNVVAGTSASLSGAIHIVPPMAIAHGYTAPFAAALKAAVTRPVIVTGRINQPQIAETIIALGQADACGMTRAMICDPEMPAKAEQGRIDDIRACIACNQACIGHFHKGYPISCIQHPETGRELIYGELKRAQKVKRVLIAGGGPAGMKAAAVLAARGHEAVLCEAAPQLGGQALLGQLLPDSAEFGGIVTNLAREMELSGVELRRNAPVDRALVDSISPDAVVIATGAKPYWPAFEGRDDVHCVDAWQVLKGAANVGSSVVIADWRADWIGMGLAEKLARDGCRVRLCVNGLMAGETIPWYVRDQTVGKLNKLGVEIIPYARLFGADGDTVYMQHTTSGEPIILDKVDTLVLAQGHESVSTLEDELADWPGEIHVIGDAASPRTAEEAVLEGLKIGAAL